MKKFIEKILGTTTKQLTWFTSIIWGATVVMAIVAPILFGIDLVSLVATASISFGVVLSGYFSKSFLENKEMNKRVIETITDTIDEFVER